MEHLELLKKIIEGISAEINLFVPSYSKDENKSSVEIEDLSFDELNKLEVLIETQNVLMTEYIDLLKKKLELNEGIKK